MPNPTLKEMLTIQRPTAPDSLYAHVAATQGEINRMDEIYTIVIDAICAEKFTLIDQWLTEFPGEGMEVTTLLSLLTATGIPGAGNDKLHERARLAHRVHQVVAAQHSPEDTASIMQGLY